MVDIFLINLGLQTVPRFCDETPVQPKIQTSKRINASRKALEKAALINTEKTKKDRNTILGFIMNNGPVSREEIKFGIKWTEYKTRDVLTKLFRENLIEKVGSGNRVTWRFINKSI
jgi:predicted HTH transcriptional regulator